MDNVIKLPGKQAHREAAEKTQFGEGEAFCLNCRHEWVAVAETGTTQLECPACHTMKGLFKYPFNVAVGQLVRICNCGNNLFYITPEGHLCPQCGIYQEY